MKISTGSAFLILLLSVCFSFGQESRPAPGPGPLPVSPPPGNMSLLPGYEHQRLRGIDSDVGQISKKDGLVIRYDIGGMAGNSAMSVSRETRAPLVWSKVINVGGEDLRIVYFNDGKIIATFERQLANFFAHTGKVEAVPEFLMMVMTYIGEDNFTSSAAKPPPFPEELVSHKRGDCWRARPPGGISLLEGYEHLACWGIDSAVGEITGKGGLVISYDNGGSVGPIIKQRYQNGKPVLPEVKVNGDTLILIWYGDSPRATFVNARANFRTTVKSQDDLVDFILMVMTYHSPVKLGAKDGKR